MNSSTADPPSFILRDKKPEYIRRTYLLLHQRLPDTEPMHGYPMEWDNVAALPVTSFENWWTKQLNDKTRNMVGKSGKKEVVAKAC